MTKKEIMSFLDVNGDGEVNFDDFDNIIKISVASLIALTLVGCSNIEQENKVDEKQFNYVHCHQNYRPDIRYKKINSYHIFKEPSSLEMGRSIKVEFEDGTIDYLNADECWLLTQIPTE